MTRTALNLLAVAVAAAAPVMPCAAQRILTALGRDCSRGWPDACQFLADPGGAPLAVLNILFPKIQPGRVVELEAKFGSATREPTRSRWS